MNGNIEKNPPSLRLWMISSAITGFITAGILTITSLGNSGWGWNSEYWNNEPWVFAFLVHFVLCLWTLLAIRWVSTIKKGPRIIFVVGIVAAVIFAVILDFSSLAVGADELPPSLRLAADFTSLSGGLHFVALPWFCLEVVALLAGLYLRKCADHIHFRRMRWLTALGIVVAMRVVLGSFPNDLAVGVIALSVGLGWGWPFPAKMMKAAEKEMEKEMETEKEKEKEDVRPVVVAPVQPVTSPVPQSIPVSAPMTVVPPRPQVSNGTPREIVALAEDFGQVRSRIANRLFGIDDLVHKTLISLLAGGHVLFEGNPGLGKTMLVKSLSDALGVVFRRGQFTPDLLPSDITGDRILDQKENTFRFQPGPLFSHVFLADEINRAPAKTQAALLEAMQELQVTVAGDRYSLGEKEPRPADMTELQAGQSPPVQKVFFVLATQNPLEQEGTYALPEAQLDRFLMRLFFRYPDHETILKILGTTFDDGNVPAGMDGDGIGFDRIIRHRAALRQHVRVDNDVRAHIARIVEATHTHPQCACGASPRAAQALMLCSVAGAALHGRAHVTIEDVNELAFHILNHRILLTQEAYYGMDQKDPLAHLRNVVDQIVATAGKR